MIKKLIKNMFNSNKKEKLINSIYYCIDRIFELKTIHKYTYKEDNFEIFRPYYSEFNITIGEVSLRFNEDYGFCINGYIESYNNLDYDNLLIIHNSLVRAYMRFYTEENHNIEKRNKENQDYNDKLREDFNKKTIDYQVERKK